jgi:hypothetical protein
MLSYWGEGRCPRCEGYGCYHQVMDRVARYLYEALFPDATV